MNLKHLSSKAKKHICEQYNVSLEELENDCSYIVREVDGNVFNGETILEDGKLVTVSRKDISYSSFMSASIIRGINYRFKKVKEVIFKAELYRRFNSN